MCIAVYAGESHGKLAGRLHLAHLRYCYLLTQILNLGNRPSQEINHGRLQFIQQLFQSIQRHGLSRENTIQSLHLVQLRYSYLLTQIY